MGVTTIGAAPGHWWAEHVAPCRGLGTMILLQASGAGAPGRVVQTGNQCLMFGLRT